MTKVLTSLLSRIVSRCNYLKEMLDWIQLDGHMSQRAKILQKQGINSIQGTEQLKAYRDAIMDLQVRTTLSEYVFSKHRFARSRYTGLLNKVCEQFQKAEDEGKMKTEVKE
jgi:hypothetical protein